MKWVIKLSHPAGKFIDKNQINKEEIFELISRAIRYFSGEDVNIDISKLTGNWKGFYRARKGKIRIIAEFDFENSIIFIEEIDWRDNVYK